MVIAARFFNRENEKQSVLIAMLGGIGDYILFTASLKGYRQAFPESNIVFVGRKELFSLINHCPYIDYFVDVNNELFRRKITEKIRVAKKIAQFKFSFFINVSYSSSHEYIENPVLIWSNARKRVVYKSNNGQDSRDYSVYNDIIESYDEKEFEIYRNNRLVSHLGILNYNEIQTKIWGMEGRYAKQLLEEYKIKDNYYVVFPGAYSIEKCWPVNRFIKVIKELSSFKDEVIICGSNRDSKISRTIINETGNLCLDLTSKTSTFELAAIISRAKFVISNDTAAVHIASALNVQCFAILGGGHYGRFLPYPFPSSIKTFSSNSTNCFWCNWKCQFNEIRCILDVSVEEVTSAIISQIYDSAI